MEYRILNDEQIEWQARRVAAAFEVKKFTCKSSDDAVFFCQGRVGRNTVRWILTRTYGPINHIKVGKGRVGCDASYSIGGQWQCSSHPAFNEQMARGLYRLGIEDEAVSAELNLSLTAHEKLELRLFMPREFWPQIWLDEKRAVG
ncbi:hypothetical protein IAD21_04168 [Abditibacteriota bacterium]|nr:hypothetical protein IAD21_04168 [Abditibacteriota bacterium]